jgi:transposase
MGNPAGVKRDFEELEERRLRAHSLLKAGLSDAEVARQLGVHRQSVGRWKKQIAEHGRGGLKKAGRAGRKSRLSEAELKKIERKLKEGPETLGYETGLWTLQRVAELIKQECGVKYHPGHVWWLLGKMGWSCQRPTGRALERDEVSIERWKKKRWPGLKKKPSGRAAR